MELNVTYQGLSNFPESNPHGVNLTAVTAEISARWKSLSKEDRIAATATCMQEIEDEREARDLAVHNVPLRVFHDARSTIQHVEKEVGGVSAYLWSRRDRSMSWFDL